MSEFAPENQRIEEVTGQMATPSPVQKPTNNPAPRRLTITVQDNYLSAYAHALEADGSESATGYGLQGSPRAEITEGTLQLVEDFLSDEKWAEFSHPAKELDGC